MYSLYIITIFLYSHRTNVKKNEREKDKPDLGRQKFHTLPLRCVYAKIKRIIAKKGIKELSEWGDKSRVGKYKQSTRYT